jgi:hypothetical protein
VLPRTRWRPGRLNEHQRVSPGSTLCGTFSWRRGECSLSGGRPWVSDSSSIGCHNFQTMVGWTKAELRWPMRAGKVRSGKIWRRLSCPKQRIDKCVPFRTFATCGPTTGTPLVTNPDRRLP